MSSLKKNQTFLFLTNKPYSPIFKQFDKIRKESSDIGSSFLLFNSSTPEKVSLQIGKRPHHIFTNEILESLGYIPIIPKSIQGSEHFALLDFYRQNPHYEYYWLIEDDVRFNGNWKDFFGSFTSDCHAYDFISCYISDFKDLPNWFWWNHFHNPKIHVPHFKRTRSFNPIYRISNGALNYLDNLLQEGWTGHQEVLLPTLLSLGGFSLADLGGDGKYVIDGFKNKFYEDNKDEPRLHPENGTMRFRPVMYRVGKKKNILYHPVKLKTV